MKYFTLNLKDRLSHTDPHHRLGAFCDGVFAIAITLLIIEIHPPHLDGHNGLSLGSALVEKWPQYLSYILSFVTIGTYWINHHFVFNILKKTNHIFTLLTLALLMTLTFIPYPTAVLGEYLMDLEHRDTAVRFYVACLAAPAVVWWGAWFYALRAQLLPVELSSEYVGCMNSKYKLSVFLFLGLVLLSYLSGLAALAGTVAITVSYLIPIPKPIYTK